MAHRLHLKLVRFNLAEINIVQNKQGKSNLQALQTKLAENQSKPTNEVPYFTFAGVDMLNLTLGKLKTLSLARPDHVDEIDFGIRNEVITNVKSAKELTQALLNLMLKRGVNLMGGPKPGDALKGRENGLKKAIEQVSTPSRK